MSLWRSSCGKVEQRRQHPARQVHSDLRNPVESFSDRQLVQDLRRPLPNQRLEVALQISRCDDRLHDLPAFVMARRIHLNEHRCRFPVARCGCGISDGDHRLGGVALMISIDAQDIVEARNRPERTEGTASAVVHGIFITQAGKVRPPAVVGIERGIADIDLAQRYRMGLMYVQRFTHAGFIDTRVTMPSSPATASASLQQHHPARSVQWFRTTRIRSAGSVPHRSLRCPDDTTGSSGRVRSRNRSRLRRTGRPTSPTWGCIPRIGYAQRNSRIVQGAATGSPQGDVLRYQSSGSLISWLS